MTEENPSKRRSKPVAYDVKIINSGGIREVYRYGETRFQGFERSKNYGANKQMLVSDVDKETGEIIQREATEKEAEAIREETRLESRQKSNIRARNDLRRLVANNFSKRSQFITLTFRENIQDIELANKTFKRFIKYMNEDLRKLGRKLKYVAVIEFQKRGAIHYHMICEGRPRNYPYANEINRWNQAIRSVTGARGETVGIVKIHDINHVKNVGRYVVKYMTKSDADKRLFGKKLYQTSRGLIRPTEKTYRIRSEEEFQELLKELGVRDKKIVFASSYLDQFTGATVEYFEVNS